LRSESQQKIP